MINWTDIPGETGSTLTKIAELSDTGQYRRLDTNIAGSTPSKAANVVVEITPPIDEEE